MNGIFPDYVGASNIDVYQSLYPDWMNPIDMVIIPAGEELGGGGYAGGRSKRIAIQQREELGLEEHDIMDIVSLLVMSGIIE